MVETRSDRFPARVPPLIFKIDLTPHGHRTMTNSPFSTRPVFRGLTALWTIIALAGLAGCQDLALLAPCLDPVSGADILIHENQSPEIPDQTTVGCFQISVVRTYATEAERELILTAETLPAADGESWYDDRFARFGYHAPHRLGAEALGYYVRRIRDLQTGEITRPDTAITARLTYHARVIHPEGVGDSAQSPGAGSVIVRLELNYYEDYRTLGPNPLAWLGVSSYTGGGPTAVREITFDAQGDVTRIEGDGGASWVIAN